LRKQQDRAVQEEQEQNVEYDDNDDDHVVIVSQCVAACCSVLQVLQCVAIDVGVVLVIVLESSSMVPAVTCRHFGQFIGVGFVLGVAVFCNGVCRSVLQCVAVCCSVLQSVAPAVISANSLVCASSLVCISCRSISFSTRIISRSYRNCPDSR